MSSIKSPVAMLIDRLAAELEANADDGLVVEGMPIYEVGPEDDWDDLDDKPHAIHLDYSTGFRELQRMGLGDEDGFTREPMRRLGDFSDWND